MLGNAKVLNAPCLLRRGKLDRYLLYVVFILFKESFATNYVLDVNRAIRQREELEKLDALANSIDSYEIVRTLIIHKTTRAKFGIFATELPQSILYLDAPRLIFITNKTCPNLIKWLMEYASYYV